MSRVVVVIVVTLIAAVGIISAAPAGAVNAGGVICKGHIGQHGCNPHWRTLT